MTEEMLDNLSEGHRVLFEIMLIEALSEGTSDDRERLRSNLIRVGFDDQCARQLLRADLPENVRASSLLRLLSLKQEPAAKPALEKKIAAEKA